MYKQPALPWMRLYRAGQKQWLSCRHASYGRHAHSGDVQIHLARKIVGRCRCISCLQTLPFKRAYFTNRRSPRSLTTERSNLSELVGRQAYSFSTSTSSARDATIYALSTAPGRAAIAVIRCSGDLCLDIYHGLCPEARSLKPRRAAVRTLCRPSGQSATPVILDSEALVLYFPGPNTATGEDVIEFHVHGGPAIVKAVLNAIPRTIPESVGIHQPIRYAEPGEFTRRAFYNDRLDLTQVEALGDTLAAETEQQRLLAVRGMTNTLNDRYEDWRNSLLSARGELEALIDFSEDQHFDESAEDFVQSISEQIRTLLARIRRTTRNAAKGELLRHGIKIALLGAPNAGKSSLLNQIVGREAAIVSAQAGTTRDVIEINVDIQGYFCKFNDLAGVRSSDDGLSTINDIEKEGIARAKAHARQADIVVVVIPVQKSIDNALGYDVELSSDIVDFVKTETQPHQEVLFVLNKIDLANHDLQLLIDKTRIALEQSFGIRKPVYPVSCLQASEAIDVKSGDTGGLQGFLSGLSTILSNITSAEQIDSSDSMSRSFDESLGTTQRQRTLLDQCAAQLEAFLNNVGSRVTTTTTSMTEAHEVDVVLAAEYLRSAADCLSKITGRGGSGDVEEVLGVVFEKFCVGK